MVSLQWRHNEHDGVSNHQPHDCLLNRLVRSRSKKTSKLRVTGLCAGNSPVTGEFPAQMASNAENVSIWWRHHDDELGSMLNQSRSPLYVWVVKFVRESSVIKHFEIPRWQIISLIYQYGVGKHSGTCWPLRFSHRWYMVCFRSVRYREFKLNGNSWGPFY